MRASVLGLEVAAGSGFVGVFVMELGLPAGANVALVVRDGSAMTPDVHSRIRAGDQLLIVATEEARIPTEARIRAVAGRGRLATWLAD
jgi:cell volume regulation protein A